MTWLFRSLLAGPYLALCMSEAEYHEKTEHLGIKAPGVWLGEGANATTHAFTTKDGKLACLVTLAPGQAEREPVEVQSTLVHEAVHVFQYWCDDVGETRPSSEFEAYSIQNIFQALMCQYNFRTAGSGVEPNQSEDPNQ